MNSEAAGYYPPRAEAQGRHLTFKTFKKKLPQVNLLRNDPLSLLCLSLQLLLLFKLTERRGDSKCIVNYHAPTRTISIRFAEAFKKASNAT